MDSPPRPPPLQLQPAPLPPALPQLAGQPLRMGEARSWEEVWALAQQLIAAKLKDPATGHVDLQVRLLHRVSLYRTSWGRFHSAE
jgi:hypothetical protein